MSRIKIETMENSALAIRKELITWIEKLQDEQMLEKIMKLKNDFELSALSSEINAEPILKENFDEQFAAGMTSEELLENVAAHLQAINSEAPSSMVSDVEAEYATKDDFEQRFAKGLTSEEAREESKKRVREWWVK